LPKSSSLRLGCNYVTERQQRDRAVCVVECALQSGQARLFPVRAGPYLPLPSLPLEVGPLNPTKGSWESAVKSSSSGVWGAAIAKIEFNAF